MRVIFSLFFIAFTCSPLCALAVTAEDCTEEGKYFDGADCVQCNEGFFCPGNNQHKNCNSPHNKSAKGAKSEAECYKECAESETAISHGKKVFSYKKIFKNDSDQNCPYTVVCDNANDKCIGYHAGGDSCYENKTACTPTITKAISGVKYWEGASGWSECYVTFCGGGYAVDGTDPYSCSTSSQHVGSSCVPTDCRVKLGNCQDSGKTGNISGSWGWDWVSNTYKEDFSECLCSITKNIDGGTSVSSCTYASGIGTSTTWNCTDAVSSCEAGFCESEDNLGSCEQVKAGYYSPSGTKTCNACPIGATSAAGSKEKKDCYITSETIFCDNSGPDKCFPLSGTFKAN